MTNKELENEMRKMIEGNIKTTITPQKFRDTRTGEVVTRFNIMDIGHMEKVGKPVPKPKKPSPDAPFSAYIQYQIDLQKWRQMR